MDNFSSKNERHQLTSHDVLGASSRYSSAMEEVTLDNHNTTLPSRDYPVHKDDKPSDPLNPKVDTRTDKLLLLFFGITTQDLQGLGKVLILCAAVSLAVTVGLVAHIIWGPPQVLPHGAVATDVPACSKIGLDVLKEGGSAVDAAIAALFCLQVVNPQASGIGGGGLALIYNHKNKEKFYVDFRETAPAAFKAEMMDQLDSKPALAVGVPGELKGLHDIYSKYGKLRWSKLLSPAIHLARSGFNMTGALHEDFWRFEKLKRFPTSKRLEQLLYPDGKKLQLETKIVRNNFADMLERIAYSGVEEFYTGKLGQEIVDELKEMGGILTMEDLARYNATAREPLFTTYNGFQVVTGPPPSSGAAVLFALNLLEGYNMNHTHATTPTYWHRMIEALKFESACRSRLGDPHFEPGVENIAKEMIDKSYAEKLRLLIRDDSVLPHSEYLTNLTAKQPDAKGTTHVSVLDTNELYVSITSTVNDFFGGGIMTSHGIVLNDELRDFAANTEGDNNANKALAGKRPLSSMTPTIVFHPKRACGLRMSIGGSNGTHIPSGVLGVLMNILTLGQTAGVAVEGPRVFACEPEKAVWVEGTRLEEVSPGILQTLTSYGQNITVINEGLSVVQVAMKRNKTLTAYSDSRKYGLAAIY
ncbi:hypothetical protein RvY_03377 [Ramazzottius varieornatus]|uniref:Gamma-glutamyltransferase n=1 Tax=Ramazzottius varieornatus TaxID=947166 RepID=A0A1D1UY36_RAMVA|nr:hypothetical protein RvY_03377 [Ramazzottius varieornatus]